MRTRITCLRTLSSSLFRTSTAAFMTNSVCPGLCTQRGANWSCLCTPLCLGPLLSPMSPQRLRPLLLLPPSRLLNQSSWHSASPHRYWAHSRACLLVLTTSASARTRRSRKSLLQGALQLVCEEHAYVWMCIRLRVLYARTCARDAYACIPIVSTNFTAKKTERAQRSHIPQPAPVPLDDVLDLTKEDTTPCLDPPAAIPTPSGDEPPAPRARAPLPAVGSSSSSPSPSPLDLVHIASLVKHLQPLAWVDDGVRCCLSLLPTFH
jgi:hypothetical protein